MTGLYGLVHLLVDGVCAWAMLGRLGGGWTGILIYNFCAFALQFPLGERPAFVQLSFQRIHFGENRSVRAIVPLITGGAAVNGFFCTGRDHPGTAFADHTIDFALLAKNTHSAVRNAPLFRHLCNRFVFHSMSPPNYS